MRLHRYFILTLALGALGLGITTSRATAGEVYKGTFTLPVQAYWNSTLMHPGEYTISMDSDVSRNSLVYLRGEDLHTVLLTGAVSLDPATHHSRLTLEQVNGTYVVREFRAGPLGKDFRFGVAKKVRAQADRASAAPPVRIPVTAGGGF